MEDQEKERLQSALEKEIERKNLEREIADIFYKMCPSVPPQMLATAVRQTIEGYRNLEYLYSIRKIPEDKLKKAMTIVEEEMLSKDTKISKEEIEKCYANTEQYKCLSNMPNCDSKEKVKVLNELAENAFVYEMPKE